MNLPQEPSPFHSTHSSGLPGLLEGLGITLLVTTYQAGKLMAIRSAQGRINTLLRSFERPMGLALQGSTKLALGTRQQVWQFRNAPDIARQLTPPGSYDACLIPRQSHVTGDIRCHEMAYVGAELWIVNTLFSCLCQLHPDYSFMPCWSPAFLPGPVPGDHCHLNGLGLVDGKPAYVTALGESTEPQGWRANRAHGGIVIDVASNTIVSRGLSMPHSPRWYDGKLWVLESGAGHLITLDPQSEAKNVVATLPGFTRGLAFFGPYAFVGLSKVREKSTFGDLPLTQSSTPLQCGIWVVDLRSGKVCQFMRFDAGVEEIFAVEVLSGIRFPEILGFQQDVLPGVFLVPPPEKISGRRKPESTKKAIAKPAQRRQRKNRPQRGDSQG